jgi:hypothetical protein
VVYIYIYNINIYLADHCFPYFRFTASATIDAPAARAAAWVLWGIFGGE